MPVRFAFPISRTSSMKGRFLILLVGLLLVGAAIVTAQDPAPQPMAVWPITEPPAIQTLPFVQDPLLAKTESLEVLVQRLKVIQEEKQKLNASEQALIADIRKVINERRIELQKIDE